MNETPARRDAAAQLVHEVIVLATRRNRGVAPAWAGDAQAMAAFKKLIAYFEPFATPADRLRLYQQQRDQVLSPSWRPFLFHGSAEQFEERRTAALSRLDAEFRAAPAERWIEWTTKYIPPTARTPSK